MRKTLFLLFWTLIPFGIHAEPTASPNEKLLQANQAFEKGELDQAADIYNSLVGQAFEGPELYYNLGNLYYRKGERGKAVLWYERALLLAPRDSDTQFNLSLARSHIKEEQEDILRRIFLTFTTTELSVLLLVLVWIFFGVLGARLMNWIKNDSWTPVALWFSGLLLVITGIWFGISLAILQQPLAVVINPPGEVRNGPGLDYAVGFTIPEGSNVLLLNRRPDWSQVGVPNQGLKGWMPNSELEQVRINPALLN